MFSRKPLTVIDDSANQSPQMPVAGLIANAAIIEDRELLQRYTELSVALGLNDNILQQEAFRAWLRQRGIAVYDEPQVKRYLDDQYGPATPETADAYGSATWGWRVLRKQTLPQNIFDGHRTNGALLFDHEYMKPVPLPVLELVLDLMASFPDATYYVSDANSEKARLKDPFLLAIYRGERFILERWDEPAFRR